MFLCVEKCTDVHSGVGQTQTDNTFHIFFTVDSGSSVHVSVELTLLF